ncbi:MAG: CrcB family protein, partial [Verrucomicrobiota bacterium]
MSLEQMMWIAAGGALGTLLRALITMRFRGLFPWSTLFVNVAGSLLIGLLVAWARFGPGLEHWQHGFDIGGFCGSFTTFSSFSYQTAVLWREGR